MKILAPPATANTRSSTQPESRRNFLNALSEQVTTICIAPLYENSTDRLAVQGPQLQRGAVHREEVVARTRAGVLLVADVDPGQVGQACELVFADAGCGKSVG